MLGILHTTSAIETFTNTKCGEVYWLAADNYSIICSFCEIKSFEFDDFLMHFKNVHIHKIGVDSPFKVEAEEDVHTLELNGNELPETVEDYTSGKLLDNTRWPHLDTASDDSQFSAATSENSEDEEYTGNIPKSSKTSPHGDHKCSECSRSYKLKRNLQYHVKKYHNRENMFKCVKCKLTFETISSLDMHCKTKHIRFSCDQCQRTYTTTTLLKIHKQTHNEERNFVCDIESCNKAFHTLKSLKRHKVQTHTTERNYVCETCGFRTKTKHDLERHYRSHTGEKPYACDDCDRCFASNSLLNEHKAMHLTVKPHVCDVCGSSFTRPKSLYHHRHLHLGVKKFVCKICGKAYAQSAGLCAHMRQHKAEQIF